MPAPDICGISVQGGVAGIVPLVKVTVGFRAAALTQVLETRAARALAHHLLAVADEAERAARGPG